jgi:hypothetical protein
MIDIKKYEDDSFRLSCSLYELLEIWSMRQTEVELSYMDQSGSVQNITARITNVFSREGVEQIEVNKEFTLPTKSIIRINDVSFSNYMQ